MIATDTSECEGGTGGRGCSLPALVLLVLLILHVCACARFYAWGSTTPLLLTYL